MLHFRKWALIGLLLLSGCGYTTKSFLSDNLKTIHVAPIKNTIDVAAEIDEDSPFRPYRPGMEVDLTNAIINRFVFDGNLKVSSAESADLLLSASLVDYRRDALRYSEGDDIQEYRLSVTADIAVIKRADGQTLWSERVTGDTTFFLSGARAKTEDEAASAAVEDAARRVVEKTNEVW